MYTKSTFLLMAAAAVMFSCSSNQSENDASGVSDDAVEAAEEMKDDVMGAVDAEDADVMDEVDGKTASTYDGAYDATSKGDNYYMDDEGNMVYTFLTEENMPVFSNGNLNEYLRDNLKYPLESRENESEGTVIVSFVVTPDGSVRDAEVVKPSNDELLNEEALRVVREMPDWTPGMMEGKAVSYKYNLPVQFVLKR